MDEVRRKRVEGGQRIRWRREECREQSVMAYSEGPGAGGKGQQDNRKE